MAYSDKYGFTPRETFVGEPGDGPIETEVVGHQFEIQHNISETTSLLAGLGHRSTTFEGNASEPNFGGSSGGRQTYFLDGKTLSRFFRYRDFESDYLVARVELARELEVDTVRHRLLIGADYDQFEHSQLILRYRPGWFPADTDIDDLDSEAYLFLDVLNPVYGQSPQPTPVPNTNREEDLTGFGIYVQDQIDVTDRLQVRMGWRWDSFEQTLTDLRKTPASKTSFSDNRISPQFGVVYSVNDGFSLYASYGEGFRQQTGSDFQGEQFDPNITESAEVGLKLDMAHFHDGVSGALNIALFQVGQSNILVNDDRPAAVAAGFFSVAVGEAKSVGLEIDANLAYENGFDLWFSYAYTDAQFTNSHPDPDGFGSLIEDGDPLINSPENQVSLQMSRSFDMGGRPAQIGGGVQHTGERLGWTAFDFNLPAYTTVRFFGQFRPSERMMLRFDLDNALDEEFYTNSYADVWVGPGTPRRWRLSGSYSF